MKMINNKWQKEIISKCEKNLEIDEIISFNKATQWLISYLAERKIAFKVINLGAGVKRITTNVNICPKCSGTGKC